MKVEEFAAKLRTVSDARLTQMHAISRGEGPEVAVTLILEEARRRGLDLESSPTEASPAETSAGAGPKPFVPSDSPKDAFAPSASIATGSEAAAHRASWTSHAPDTLEGDGESENPSGDPALTPPEAPGPEMNGAARGSKWLDEETQSSRLPKLLKVILYLLALAGLVAAGYKFLHRG